MPWVTVLDCANTVSIVQSTIIYIMQVNKKAAKMSKKVD